MDEISPMITASEHTHTFGSPYISFLSGNAVPPNLNRRKLDETLRKPQARILNLEQRISTSQDELADALRRQEKVHTFVQGHQRLLGGVHCLSDEVLRNIFLNCLPDGHNAVMSPSESPMLLGTICHRWRSILLHTPSMWSTLHISLARVFFANPAGTSEWGTLGDSDICEISETDLEDRVHQGCSLIHEWLCRSAGRPLSISLDAPPDPGPLKRFLFPYPNAILAFSHQLHTIDLSVAYGGLLEGLAELQPEDLPMLHSISIRFSIRLNRKQSSGMAVWNSSGLFTAPSIRRLSISFLNYHYSRLPVGWSDLTHFALAQSVAPTRRFHYWETLGVIGAYALLSDCPWLVECTLDLHDFNGNPWHGMTNLVHLPFLESLTLNDACVSLHTLAAQLHLPKLRSLTFQSEPNVRRSAEISPLVPLLLHNGSHVEQLTTDITRLSYADLMSCIQLVPSLLSFTHRTKRWIYTTASPPPPPILPTSILDAFLRVLAEPGLGWGGFTCLPLLEHLTIQDATYMSDTAVASFIHSRMRSSPYSMGTRLGIKLKSVDATIPHIMKEDIGPALENYRNLKCNIHYCPLFPPIDLENFWSFDCPPRKHFWFEDSDDSDVYDSDMYDPDAY